MKRTTAPQVREKHVNPDNRRARPENKDSLDHREGEEQEDKGTSTTHNRKEHHTPPKKKH